MAGSGRRVPDTLKEEWNCQRDRSVPENPYRGHDGRSTWRDIPRLHSFRNPGRVSLTKEHTPSPHPVRVTGPVYRWLYPTLTPYLDFYEYFRVLRNPCHPPNRTLLRGGVGIRLYTETQGYSSGLSKVKDVDVPPSTSLLLVVNNLVLHSVWDECWTTRKIRN